MQVDYQDYLEAGYRIMALHSVANGICTCGDANCKALYKHPRASNWQHTPRWSEEQIDAMEQYGQLATGFGVVLDDDLILDIDPRNGGFESYAQLKEDLHIDPETEAGFVVETGGGGLHIYFKNRDNTPLVSHLSQYPGIDFKSSGFVVGCGSLHASGNTYEPKKGTPHDTGEAPQGIITLLEKKDTYRASYDGVHIDLTDAELEKMLGYYKNTDLDYEDWIRCGMAIHHATNGAGFELWDRWSQISDKYDPKDMEKKWHSFGKTANPVTIGTLIYHAKQGGYKQPVTFDAEIKELPSGTAETVDLLRPPGFVGQVTEWINKQCRFPREHLAVAAALSAIGNICGLRYIDEYYGVTSNQFIFCVAGSATGKEAVQQAQAEIHKVAAMGPATHGSIKSEQEIVRNLVKHQAALYIIDEMGFVLQKIKNARQRGGAAYLEGVIGMLMSAYSKANGYMLLSGDVRDAVRSDLNKEIAQLRKIEDQEGVPQGGKIEKIEQQLKSLDTGLEAPFLSLIGYTTPVTFNQLVDREQATNGFFGRSIIVNEKNTNPKAKKRFKPEPMSMPLQMAITSLAGNYKDGRVEMEGDRVAIPTTVEALDYLDDLQDEFHRMAEDTKEMVLEAVPRRAFELVLKVSLTLAAPEGIRTLEHVQWAHAFVLRDVNEKLNLAAGNMAEEDNRHGEALSRRILAQLDKDDGETTGVIANRCRPYTKEDVEKALANLEALKKVRSEDAQRKGSKRWYLL